MMVIIAQNIALLVTVSLHCSEEYIVTNTISMVAMEYESDIMHTCQLSHPECDTHLRGQSHSRTFNKLKKLGDLKLRLWT